MRNFQGLPPLDNFQGIEKFWKIFQGIEKFWNNFQGIGKPWSCSSKKAPSSIHHIVS